MEAGTRILIVDDEPLNRLILEDLLADHYAVHALGNGRQALEYLTTAGTVDLILMDVVMPVMDGFEACRRIKAEPRLRDIPLLFLTSLESAADAALAIAEQFTEIARSFSDASDKQNEGSTQA